MEVGSAVSGHDEPRCSAGPGFRNDARANEPSGALTSVLDGTSSATQATHVRASSPVGRLVIAYAVLTALLDLVVLLPGNPSPSSIWGLVGLVLIQSLLVWRLTYGSALAWLFGLLSALGAVASVPLAGPPIGVTETVFVVVCLAQAGVLLTPAVLGRVWSQRETPRAAA